MKIKKVTAAVVTIATIITIATITAIVAASVVATIIISKVSLQPATAFIYFFLRTVTLTRLEIAILLVRTIAVVAESEHQLDQRLEVNFTKVHYCFML